MSARVRPMESEWYDLCPRACSGGCFAEWQELPARAASASLKRRWSASFTAWLLTRACSDDLLHANIEKRPELACRASSLAFQKRAIGKLRSTLEQMEAMGQTTVQLHALRDEGVFVLVAEGQKSLAFQQHFQFALCRMVELSVERWIAEIDSRLHTAEFGGVCPHLNERYAHEDRKQRLCEVLAHLATDHTESAGVRGISLVQSLAETARGAREHGTQRVRALASSFARAAECVCEASALHEGARDASEVSVELRTQWVQMAQARFSGAEAMAREVERANSRLCSLLRQIAIYVDSCGFEANLQTNLLQLVIDHSEVLKSGMLAAEARCCMFATSLEEGSISPSGLAVSRQSCGDGNMPSLGHVGSTTGDWSCFRTNDLRASATTRLEAVVHDCLVAGIFPTGAAGPQVLLQAVSFAEREIANELRWNIGTVPEIVLRPEKRARRVTIGLSDALPLFPVVQQASGGAESEGEEIASCDGSQRSQDAVASEARGRKRLDVYKSNPLLLTMVDRNTLATMREYLMDLPADRFADNGGCFEATVAGFVQAMRQAKPMMLANKLTRPQEAVVRLVKRVSKRVQKSFAASGEAGRGRLEMYVLRTPTNRNSPRVLRVASGQVQWLCGELERVETWLREMSFQTLKTNYLKHVANEYADAVAIVNASLVMGEC